MTVSAKKIARIALTENQKLYRSVMNRGRMPSVEMPPPIRGMEGPFRFKSGMILYYDRREGKYYDRGRDMYLSHEEAEFATRTAASGLYGHTKSVQRQAESAIKKIQKRAAQLTRTLEHRHPEIGSYFSDRGMTSTCNAAKCLSVACAINKPRPRIKNGPMGYRPACAKAAHKAIGDIILFSGDIAHQLHSRAGNHRGFLSTHAEQTGCPYTQLLLEMLPHEG